MKSILEREKGFEAEFIYNEELAFRVTARRNRLFGMWVAARLGLPAGKEAESYANAVITADLQTPSDDDIIQKVWTDLTEKGIAVTEAELRIELAFASAESRRQLLAS
jgi:hypothetical protein